MFRKICWYINKIILLLIVCLRILLYCILHPRKFFNLGFTLYTSVNEFFRGSHGKLRKFEETETYRKMTDCVHFSKSNVFNVDLKVTYAIETQALASLVTLFQPRTIFEIGTYNGFTTIHFAANSPDDCQIFTLDLPPDFDQKSKNNSAQYSYSDLLVIELSMKHANERIYRNHPQAYKIKELFGDSSRFDFSPYYGKMDMVFIDGNHSYPFVRSDTENALKMLSEDGIIIWHDYDYICHRDIFKYLNRLSAEYAVYSIANTRLAIYGKKLL